MVTIPTIDQISGTTVMNKLRSLIRKFIEFATDVSEEMDYVSEQSQEAYNMASSIDLTNYYTKSEVDNLIASIDLSDYYTKSEINATFTNYYTKTETDSVLALKQDKLTAISPIIIDENNISLNEWRIYDNLDWRGLFDVSTNARPTLKDMIVKITYLDRGICYYIPKGSSSATMNIASPLSYQNNSNTSFQLISYENNLGNILNSSGDSLNWTRVNFKITLNTTPCTIDLDKSTESISKRTAESGLMGGICIYVRD